MCRNFPVLNLFIINPAANTFFFLFFIKPLIQEHITNFVSTRGLWIIVYYTKVHIDFIALIHPIQWTIAYPVGADRPAKRQKKTSCVSTGQAGPVLCTRQVACSTSFLSRQRDVIASFSFGACLCARNIFIRSLSSDFHCYW